MVYGGTTRAGSCEGAPQLDIVSAFQSYGKYLQDGKTAKAEIELYNTIRHACPGPGACGGVSAVYAFGLTLSYFPKEDVHGKYYGKRRRSSRDDPAGVLF